MKIIITTLLLVATPLAAKSSDKKLQRHITSIVADVQSQYGNSTPACNQCVRELFNKIFDTRELNEMLSNDMVRYWRDKSSKWIEISISEAQNQANKGNFVVAGWEDKSGGLGHVCVIVPGEEVEGRWCGIGGTVPVAMDTGRNRRETSIGLNWCYSKEKQPDVEFFHYHKPIPKKY